MSAAEKIEHAEEMLDVGSLVQFPGQPRTPQEDDADIVELAADMARRGQDTAIIVRSTDDGSTWEVLAGNRRWAAARLNEWATIRAIIRRDLNENDEAALELCLAENLQHKKLAPLEEADGLAELYQAMGSRATLAELASRVGKSEKYVREMLTLRGIDDEIREMAPFIERGALYALAVTSPIAQARIAKRLRIVLEHQPRVTRSNVVDILDRENVTRSLATVRWKLDDAELVPEAGACNVCPKRTGQGALLDDVVNKSDVCADDECYAGKSAAQREREAAAARDEGTKVLSSKESARVLEHGRPRPDSAYVSRDERVMIGDKQVKIGNLVGAGDAVLVLAQDVETGAPVPMYQRKDVDAAVQAKRAQLAQEAAASSKKSGAVAPAKVDPKRAAAQAAGKNKEELANRTARIALEQVFEEVTSGRVKLVTALLWIIEDSAITVDHPELVLRRGLKAGEGRSYEKGVVEIARGYAKVGQTTALVGLLVEMCATRMMPFRGHAGDGPAAKKFGLDLHAIGKQASSELAREKLGPVVGKKAGRR